MLAKGQANYVLTAHSAIADPDFLIKVREGKEEDIRPCLKCDLCLDHGRRKSKFVGNELVMASEKFLPSLCSKQVVLIGGGAIGIELGIHLSGLNHTCTIIEMGNCIGEKRQLTERTAYLNAMKKYQVASMVNTTCVGTKPLETERDKFIDSAFDVINVGDCVKASSIVHAVHTGFNAGLTL